MANPKPARADVRRNRERLLTAAADVFAIQGTEASLDDIARHAQIGNATLYRHFPTRHDLVEALLVERYDALRAIAQDLTTSPDPRNALIDWLRAFITHITAYRGLAACVMSALRDHESDLSTSCQAMRTAAADLLTRAQDSGHIRADLTISEVLRLTNGIALATEQHPAETSRLLSLLIEGLHRQNARHTPT
jgi:AcrR family transcriptional regulator